MVWRFVDEPPFTQPLNKPMVDNRQNSIENYRAAKGNFDFSYYFDFRWSVHDDDVLILLIEN